MSEQVTKVARTKEDDLEGAGHFVCILFLFVSSSIDFAYIPDSSVARGFTREFAMACAAALEEQSLSPSPRAASIEATQQVQASVRDVWLPNG